MVLIGLSAEGIRFFLVPAQCLNGEVDGFIGLLDQLIDLVVHLNPNVLLLAQQADCLDEHARLPLEQLPPLLPQFLAIVDLLLDDSCIRWGVLSCLPT